MSQEYDRLQKNKKDQLAPAFVFRMAVLLFLIGLERRNRRPGAVLRGK